MFQEPGKPTDVQRVCMRTGCRKPDAGVWSTWMERSTLRGGALLPIAETPRKPVVFAAGPPRVEFENVLLAVPRAEPLILGNTLRLFG